MPLGVEFVFFDVGETLIDESRVWRGWASYLGVSSAAFLAALDEVIAAGQHHEEVFRRFNPRFDLRVARRQRESRGDMDVFNTTDLYSDAGPCLNTLRSMGFKVGVAGNAPPTGGFLEALTVDMVTSAAELGAEKPAALFFARLAHRAGVPPGKIAYVGDRLDNDIIPARDAGMISVFIERGPWGRSHATRREAAIAAIELSSLVDLPQALFRAV